MDGILDEKVPGIPSGTNLISGEKNKRGKREHQQWKSGIAKKKADAATRAHKKNIKPGKNPEYRKKHLAHADASREDKRRETYGSLHTTVKKYQDDRAAWRRKQTTSHNESFGGELEEYQGQMYDSPSDKKVRNQKSDARLKLNRIGVQAQQDRRAQKARLNQIWAKGHQASTTRK